MELTRCPAIYRLYNAIICSSTSVSQAPSPVFASDHTRGRSLAIKSDDKRNVGRPFICCYRRHDNETNCSVFAWVDATASPPFSQFTSSTLSLLSSSTLPIPPWLTLSSQSCQPLHFQHRHVASRSVQILTNSCESTGIHPECTHRMCCSHCIEARGCRARADVVTHEGIQYVVSPCHHTRHLPRHL